MAAANCLSDRAKLARKDNDAAGALRHAELALQRFREAGTGRTVDEAFLLGSIAAALQLNSQPVEGQRYFQAATEKFRSVGRDLDLQALSMKSDWAGLESAAGNPRGALRLYEEIERSVLQRDAKARPPAVIVQNRGRMLQFLGQYQQARVVYETSLVLVEAEGNQEFRTQILLKLASVAQDLGDRNGAVRYLQLANQSLDPSVAPGSSVSTSRMLVEAKLHLMDRRLDSARELYARTMSIGKRDVAISAALGKAEVELLAGDANAAARDARFALDIARRLQADMPFSHRTGLSWLLIGRASAKLGDVVRAHQAFVAAEHHLSNTVDTVHPALLEARQLLSQSGH
jgi:tetratricopeptide (TPR) repeat protein